MMSNAETMDWVRGHGKEVDPKLWRTDPPASDSTDENPDSPGLDAPNQPPGPQSNPRAFFARMQRQSKLYDCKPELGLVEP
jgi:hypothetical protein